MDIVQSIGVIYGIGATAIVLGIAMSAILGAVLCASTRDDAFDAADRKGKWIWVGLLVGSAIVVVTRLPFLSWIGLVVIGLYWFDVRPQIKDILNGNYGW